MHTPRVIIAGGRGVAGTAITRLLVQRGYRVTLLTRKPASNTRTVDHIAWDGATPGPWARALEHACGLINLTGAGQPANAQEARNAVAVLADAMGRCKDAPPVWLQASSLGIYGGDDRTRPADECTAAGDDAMARSWHAVEETFQHPDLPGVRRAVYRLGLVLDDGAQAQQRLAHFARWTRQAPDDRMEARLHWIHPDDLARLLYWGLRMEIIAGPYNACVPNPARLGSLCGFSARESTGIPADCALLGGMPEALVPAAPRRFIDIAYQFRNEDIAALLSQAPTEQAESPRQSKEAALR